MRSLTSLIAVLVIVGVACTGTGDDDVDNAGGGGEATAAAVPATIVPDDICRNDAIAVGDAGRWRLTDDLPPAWQGRAEVSGAVEQTDDGEWSFVADGERLAATDNLTAPPMCVPWTEPSPADDG